MLYVNITINVLTSTFFYLFAHTGSVGVLLLSLLSSSFPNKQTQITPPRRVLLGPMVPLCCLQSQGRQAATICTFVHPNKLRFLPVVRTARFLYTFIRVSSCQMFLLCSFTSSWLPAGCNISPAVGIGNYVPGGGQGKVDYEE